MANDSRLPAVALLALTLLGGCTAEPDYVPAGGHVFYNGSPLTSGVVMFQPTNGPPAIGLIQSDGTFELRTPGRGDGARIGPNAVRISSREASRDQSTEIALGPLLIPERYTDFTSSGLTAEVKPQSNEPFIFRLD